MTQSNRKKLTIDPLTKIAITGAGGFLGQRVVENLVHRGFKNIHCLVRSIESVILLDEIANKADSQITLNYFRGTLLNRQDCSKLVNGAEIIFHLAAGTGLKAVPDAFLNSVVTTRNLIEAAIASGSLKRFVNMSSFSVYTGKTQSKNIIDESSPLEERPESRSEAYCFAKVKQDLLVESYAESSNFPFVHIRPGTVYGPGKHSIPGRVGIDTFGFFIHLGGPSNLPLTYVDNCADAIVLAGLVPGIERETFNVVDNDLPTSRKFLRIYKKRVRKFRSIYVPHFASWLFCAAWEKYCDWSSNQLPRAFTRREWDAYWKKVFYSNEKAKKMLGWEPKVSTGDGLEIYCQACREQFANN